MNKPGYKKLSFVTAVLGFMTLLPAQADILIYPMKGQSNQQLSKDRYECHVWAVQQSGFDPSAAQAAQVAPQTQQQGGQVIRGGMRGAAMGAAVGAIAGDAGKGAAIGATAGGITGGFKRMNQNQSAQTQAPATAAGQDTYSRAIKACLTGRNYSVN
ncbi:MAG: glycine zipper domain-containing protein [Methylococcaceae bacterium]